MLRRVPVEPTRRPLVAPAFRRRLSLSVALLLIAVGVASPSRASATTPLSPARITRVSAPEFTEDFTFGAEGEVWMISGENEMIDRMTQSGFLTGELTPPASFLTRELTRGPGNTIWFVQPASHQLVYITPPHSFREVPIPDQSGLHVGPEAAAPSDAEHVWFAGAGLEEEGEFAIFGYVGRATLSGDVEVFPLGKSHDPLKIVQGSDGNGWFTDGSAIGRVTPAGSITEFTLPEGRTPLGLTEGSDGNVWFTANPGAVGKITPAGAITLWPVPDAVESSPSIVAAPEGDLWFGMRFGELGRMTTAGELTAFSGAATPAGIHNLAIAPDGTLWYEEYGGAKSELIRLVIPFAPRATAPPVVTGSGLEGTSLSLALGSWENAAGFAIQWLSCAPAGAPCEPIPGATGTSIALGPGVLGRVLRASVTATSEGGSTAALSNASPVVHAPPTRPKLKTFTTAPRVSAFMKWLFGWSPRSHRTSVRHLTVELRSHGVTVEVLCDGGGCPFSKRKANLTVRLKHCKHGGHCTRQASVVDLADLFRGAHLKPKDVITVEVLHAGMVGKAFRFVTRPGGVPSERVGCLALGSRKFSLSC